MFAIYNNGLVGFRSSVDSIEDIKKIQETSLNPDNQNVKSFSSHLNQENKRNFLESYKKVANIDTLEPAFKVKDIMTKDVVYMDIGSTLEEIYEIIKNKKVQQIPITSFGKKIIGIVNKKLILSLIMDDIDIAKEIINRKVNDIYLPEILTADPESDVRKVVQVMLDLQLDAIPIVNESDILMGIVSKTDVLKAFSHFPKLQLWS